MRRGARGEGAGGGAGGCMEGVGEDGVADSDALIGGEGYAVEGGEAREVPDELGAVGGEVEHGAAVEVGFGERELRQRGERCERGELRQRAQTVCCQVQALQVRQRRKRPHVLQQVVLHPEFPQVCQDLPAPLNTEWPTLTLDA